MITSINAPWEPDTWSHALQDAFRRPRDLLAYLGLTDANLAVDVDHEPAFATLVPRGFAARMRPEADDPLLLQVLPLLRERATAAGFGLDPLAESQFVKAPGLIQKYHGRALMITTPGCAINCRYCFRRHFPYHEHRSSQHDAAIRALIADPSVHEIILSGGDPLLLPDKPLRRLVDALDAIPHIERIRLHTRLPVVLPERTTQALVDTLGNRRSQIVVVVHTNHPAELNASTFRAFTCLRAAGAWLFNQTVLLKGINASAQTQTELAHALFGQGVLPYYLHLPDEVDGTEHFYVSITDAQPIYREMQARLPGYLLPRLVKEVAGQPAKTFVHEITYEPPTI